MKRTLCVAALAAFILSLPAWGQEIRVTSPVAGARWCIGSSYTVTWTKSGTMDANVSIRLRLRGGGEEGVVTMTDRTENDGSFGPWEVPAGTTPGEYLVRIRTIDGAVTGSSELFDVADCSAPGATITVTAPNGGESWALGSPHDITWTQSGVSGTVNIDLLRDGSVLGPIASGIAATAGSHRWTVGSYTGGTASARGGYRVRVRHSSGTPSDDSNRDFAIAAEGTEPPGGASITVTAPVAGERWWWGSRLTIAWTTTGALNPMANITLRRRSALETDPPSARIADGCANNGRFTWFIPDGVCEDNYFVRVKSGGVQGDSAYFAIISPVTPGGRGSDLPGPDTPIRADLSMPGVGVEYYNGHVVAWVKNNGPDSVRDHDVAFRLHFPERESGARIITKRITVPVGAEEGVQLLAMAAGDIPAAGLRTIVSIDAALSHVVDANRLNQHRDERIFADNRPPIDLGIRLTGSTVERVIGGGSSTHYKARSRGTMHMTRSGGGPTEFRRMNCRWELQQRRRDGTGDWLYVRETSSGTIQLGPFRDGEETTQSVSIDSMIHHNWPEYLDFRIAFILDPQGGVNDPNQDNNRTYTSAFGMD